MDVSPAQGGQAGGDSLRLTGHDFLGHGAPVVYIGARAAKAVVIHSPWLVTVMTPQRDVPATVDVVLVFADETRMEVPGAFTYTEQVGIVLQPAIGGGMSPPH